MTLQTSFLHRAIDGPNALSMRLVAAEDADYIYGLRSDPTYNTHLSVVSGGVQAQRAWIDSYKEHEAAGSQYYFIMENRAGQRCGLVRLYEITPDHFTWGSWILDENKPPKAALESAFLIYQIAFEHLGLPRAVFEVMAENSHTLAFHRRFGARETDADDTNIYFDYTSDQFARDKEKFIQILKGTS